MRAALIVSFSLCWVASATFAQTSPPSAPLKSPDSTAPSVSGPGDTAEKRLESPEADVTDALASCLAMWEPTTHMTRREWARACRRVADRLNNTTIE